MLQLLTRSLLALALFVLLVLFAPPLAAQVEWPRQVPDDAAFLVAVEALKAGVEDGFESLRGERLDAENWDPVLPAGMLKHQVEGDYDQRNCLTGFARFDFWLYRASFQKVHLPSEDEVATLEADYVRLRAALLSAAGDWRVESKPPQSGDSDVMLVQRSGDGDESSIRLRLMRGASRDGWWQLLLVAKAPLLELPSFAAVEPATYRGIPTDAGFSSAVEVMLASAYEGLEPLKGLVVPDEVASRRGGVPTWGLMPLEGLPSDPEGRAHSMSDYGAYTSGSYSFASIVDPTEEQRAELAAHFDHFAKLLGAHSAGWTVERRIQAYSMLFEDSQRFGLVPGPGMAVQRFDGESVPSIELWLRKGPSGYQDVTWEPTDDECWTLMLSCTAQGSPLPGMGAAGWVAELLDPFELPPVPTDLERIVLDLVADAPAGFAGHATPELLGRFDWSTHQRTLDDPIEPTGRPRQALTVHLLDSPDPFALRDSLVILEDSRRSMASVRLGLLSVPGVDQSSRRAADLWMELVVERLAAALDGWRVRVDDIDGGKEDFQVRLATLDGLRADGHPVWVQVERMVSPIRVPGQPMGDLLQLALYVSTDHQATVGQDLAGRWDAAVAAGEEPLASILGVFGDPLAGRVEPGDRFVPDGGGPIDLLGLFGGGGEPELRYDVIRDGRYTEVVLTPPRLSLARWSELRAEEHVGKLSAAALALCGGRLDLAEVSALLRELVVAGETEFAEQSGLITDHELMTSRFVLWQAEAAPTKDLVEVVRSGLATTFGGGWILDDTTRNTGPVFDPYARQTHWSARPEGPHGTKPWVELVEFLHEGQAYLALEVHAFTAAHRAAHADEPRGLWFDDLTGDCQNGYGVAWCHHERVSFEGPFEAGLPDGEGRHLYPGDKAMVGVRYEAGRLRTIGHKPVPPAPPVTSIADARDSWFFDQLPDLTQDSEEDGPYKQFPWVHEEQDDWWDSDSETLGHSGDSGWRRPTYSSRVCNGCWGDGWVDTSSFEDVYDYTSTSTSTSLWMGGYDAIETYKGRKRVYRSDPCQRCAGTGREYY